MQLTYKIENYYPYESRVFVVYTPVDTAFEPLGGWVYITADMTEQQIKDKVLAEAPLSRWEATKSSAVAALIGQVDTGVATPPTPDPVPVPPPVVIPEPPTPEQVEAQRQAILWNAAHMVEYNAISGSAVGLVTLGILQQKPKCQAVQAWIQALWTEYYTRKATGSTDYDFSSFSNCPHTVPELMQELGL